MMKFILPVLFACTLLQLHSIAQVCTGSPGDPILSETFGAGYNKLPAYKTTFDNVNGCPLKGTYTLSNFLFGCGNRTWGQMVGDHTGDYNGNYMLVNAESTPGTVYRDTAKGLCGNTVYQLGLYITTVMTKLACDGKPVLPNVKYHVSSLTGTVLASDSTGFLPLADEKNWKYYSIAFTTPAVTNDVIVSITVNPVYGCGSAFAMDDITLRACGPTITATIDGTPGPADLCADYTNPLVMKAVFSPGFADPALQWQSSTDTGKTWMDVPGQTSATYTVPHRSSGAVLYRAMIAEKANINSLKCRISSNIISTSIHPVAQHTPPQDMAGCLGKTFFFPAPDGFARQILWAGPNAYQSAQVNASIPAISYADTGLYTRTQTFLYGCTSYDTFYLKVFPGTTINVLPATPLCEGQQEQLLATATDSVGYLWTPATGLSNPSIANPVAKPTDTTRYKVLITNRYGCKDSAFLIINVYRRPVVNAGPDKTILAGDTAVLNASVSGTSTSYSWQPTSFISNTGAETPSVFPPANTAYTLTAVSAVGCGSASDNVLVKVYSSFLIPNAFSPNDDGRNDRFEILSLDNYTVDHLFIYNRYGQVVFSAKGNYQSWDGKFKGIPQPQGMYVYHLEIRAPSRQTIVKKGTLLLVR